MRLEGESGDLTITGSFNGDGSNLVDGKWTLGANGTSDYTFTGIGFTQTTNDPILYLARGRVYEFVNTMNVTHLRLENPLVVAPSIGVLLIMEHRMEQ